MKAARRASIDEEEARKIRVVESAAGTSRSTDVEAVGGTTDSVVADEVLLLMRTPLRVSRLQR